MASQLDICNQALDTVAATPIVSIDEASPAGKACKRLYPQALLSTLESMDWRFARARYRLNLLTDETVPKEWRYVYQRPSDCLRARYIEPLSLSGRSVFDQDRHSLQPSRHTLHAPRFAAEGDLIYSDIEDPVLIYTRRVDEPGKLPALFVDAMAAYLGHRLGAALRVDPNLVQIAMNAHDAALQKAAAADLNESFDPEDRQAGWIEARQ